ncbi:MAG TPA: amino acid ABC transporter substrate-binding protein [Stellaceae bacterium]|nr:amino acid ABC transporter substrate-binding protein [Stellaceae bacterium]
MTGRLMRSTRIVALVLAAALLAAAPAAAQELTGTLKRIKDTGTVTLGYRVSSIPFSYLNKRGEPIGYAIDLCKAVVEDISAELDGSEITIAYKAVTSESRIPAIVSGQIDLECGSTTSNFERKKQVAFSPVYFVSGTKLLVKRGSGIASWRDLGGKTVVVTAGTTNEAAIRAIAAKQKLVVKLIVGSDHQRSFDMLKSGAADAFATDDVLLYGLVATTKSGAAYHVVGDFLSYDPYALMFRKDDADFAAVVERSFARLAASREIVELYDKWFLQRLPTGERLDLAMSPQLEEFFRVLGVPE